MKQLEHFCGKNLSIGLFGGSFDPPHAGHLYVAEDALARFHLDYVFWIVTTQNPLKSHQPSAFETRLKLCRDATKSNPRMFVSTIEEEIHDTFELISFLQKNCRNEYVWIMGSDTLVGFDSWTNWREMLGTIKMIVYERPGFSLEQIKSKVAPEILEAKCELGHFKRSKLPAWTLIQGETIDISSTQLRRQAEPAL